MENMLDWLTCHTNQISYLLYLRFNLTQPINRAADGYNTEFPLYYFVCIFISNLFIETSLQMHNWYERYVATKILVKLCIPFVTLTLPYPQAFVRL